MRKTIPQIDLITAVISHLTMDLITLVALGPLATTLYQILLLLLLLHIQVLQIICTPAILIKNIITDTTAQNITRISTEILTTNTIQAITDYNQYHKKTKKKTTLKNSKEIHKSAVN